MNHTDPDGWFWDRAFWLPPKVKWSDFDSVDGKYAQFHHLYYPIPIAVALIFLRYCLDTLVFHPLGIYFFGMSRRQSNSIQNPVLEQVYLVNRSRKISHNEIVALAKKVDMQVRQVERWFRRRIALNKPTKLKKFSECSWRLFCYTSAIIIGVNALWDQPWLTDVMYAWYGYPQDHVLTSAIWWYYMMSMALYYSFMISQFSDVHRKDFWQMFIHHIATIFLLGMSYTINMFRFGTLVLLVHDIADPFLEAAKLAKYVQFTKTCWTCFSAFFGLFVLTRLYIYPFIILKSMFLDADPHFPFFPCLYIFYTMLTLLLVLHYFWSYLLFKVVYRAGFGDDLRDSRSSSESYCSDSEVDDGVGSDRKSKTFSN